MKIYDESKTKILENPDLQKGYLSAEKLFIAHHDAINPITKREKDYRGIWITNVIQEGQEAYDETEEVYVYIPYTADELAKIEIDRYKILLKESDYKAIKYAEGEISETEYAPIKAQRKAWREEIGKRGG